MLFFQLDGAPPHIHSEVTAHSYLIDGLAVWGPFHDRHVLQTPSLLDFFLWGCIKDQIYVPHCQRRWEI
jgi:hypothetical protein